MEEEQEVNGDLGCLQKPSSSQSNVGTADDSQPILASSITRDIKEEQKINGDLECLQKPSDSPPSAVATCDRRVNTYFCFHCLCQCVHQPVFLSAHSSIRLSVCLSV
jgi:hypothetical protein